MSPPEPAADPKQQTQKTPPGTPTPSDNPPLGTNPPAGDEPGDDGPLGGEPEEDGDDKPKDGEKDGEKGKEGDDDAPKPEDYKFKLPDGVEVDEAQLDAYRQWAAEQKLTPAQAQAALDYYQQAMEAFAEQEMQQTREEIARWKQEARSMWGNEYEQNLAAANRALTSMRSELGDRYQELVSILRTTGLGTHPAVLALFHTVSKYTAEAQTRSGAPGAEDSREARLRRMYPTLSNEE